MFIRNSVVKRLASRLRSNSFAAARRRKSTSSLANARAEASKMAIRDFGEIAEKLRRSTVLVLAGERGNGSGVIWSADGVIVTNAHVVRSSRMRVQLWDGRELDAGVVSRDSQHDLAELRVTAADLPAIVVADSSQVRPGELAIAIGNPFGFVGALTTGVVHAVGPLAGPLRRFGSPH